MPLDYPPAKKKIHIKNPFLHLLTKKSSTLVLIKAELIRKYYRQNLDIFFNNKSFIQLKIRFHTKRKEKELIFLKKKNIHNFRSIKFLCLLLLTLKTEWIETEQPLVWVLSHKEIQWIFSLDKILPQLSRQLPLHSAARVDEEHWRPEHGRLGKQRRQQSIKRRYQIWVPQGRDHRDYSIREPASQKPNFSITKV